MITRALATVPKDLERGLEDQEIRGRIQTNRTAAWEIGQNTEKCFRDLG